MKILFCVQPLSVYCMATGSYSLPPEHVPSPSFSCCFWASCQSLRGSSFSLASELPSPCSSPRRWVCPVTSPCHGRQVTSAPRIDWPCRRALGRGSCSWARASPLPWRGHWVGFSVHRRNHGSVGDTSPAGHKEPTIEELRAQGT